MINTKVLKIKYIPAYASALLHANEAPTQQAAGYSNKINEKLKKINSMILH